MAAAPRPLLLATLLAGSAGLASLWPLSSYAFGPLLLPAVLALMALGAAIVREPAFGVAGVAALAPLLNSAVPVEALGFGQGPRPLQLVVPALALVTFVYSTLLASNSGWGRHARIIGGGFAALLLAAAVSSLFAFDPGESVNKLMLVVTAVVVFATVPIVCRRREQVLIVVGGVLVGLLLVSVQGLIQYSTETFSTQGFVSGFEVVGRIEGSFGHPNLLAGYLAALIPLAFIVAAGRRFPPGLRALGVISGGLAVPALYLTFGRGALVGLIGGTIIWLAVLRPRLSIAALVVTALAIVIAMPATLKERFDPQTSEGDITLRADIWAASLAIYGERPITGVGVNNFSIAYSELPSTAASASQRRLLHRDQLLIPPHPQSIYLQALAEQGTVGVAALLAFIGTGLLVVFRASRSSHPTSRALGLAVGIGLLSILIHGLGEVPLMSEALLPLAALLALVAVLVDSEGALEPDRFAGVSRA